jgi:ribosomal protein S27E|tara:strand:+ start:296 stop:1435 length:1140 start_codon:yes stop_codon:yes gene_type:complete
MKERCSKKRIHVIDNTKEISTLDDIHINSIKKFEIKNNRIETITQQIKDLNIIALTNIHWLSNVEIKEKIKDYNQELNKLNTENELDYYENVGEILFNYYDIVNQTVGIKQLNPTKYTILEALNIKIDNNEHLSEYKDKSKLVNEYLAITDNKYINHIDGEFTNTKCINCSNEMTNLVQEALSVCLSCGYQDVLLAEQNRPIMLYDKKDGIHYSYKRINHFREWISQIQGKESTDIPNEVFEKILNELKKEKITDTAKLTPKFMRTILKKLRTHKYYEHTAYIINRINGIPPPQFSPELEQNLSNMFMQTQPLFIKYAPANRLNFISYSYILHKFFLILNIPEYLPLFPLLKSRQKIAQNEDVFKKICKELKWTWIPSI